LPPRVAAATDDHAAALERAIANLTRLLGSIDDPREAAALVSERAAMRAEFAAATRGANVVPLRRPTNR
jgi:hypothetical protein